MLKIGEFSKLSQITIKALRYYEEEGLLPPASIDKDSGYRYYENYQLVTASKIKSFRQLGLSIEDIKSVFCGTDPREVLLKRKDELEKEKIGIDTQLSIISHILEDKKMKYQVIEKNIPETIVYYSEAVVSDYSDLMQWIPAQGEACLKLNPGLECASPAYEFLEYLDGEYKEKDIKVRHNEAVKSIGKEDEQIKFKKIPSTKVLSVLHKGSYSNIGEAYAFVLDYAEKNGYRCTGYLRECYIDGIWNKESEDDWLTEVQMPIE